MKQMNWKIFEKDNKLHVLLNGNINRRLDMTHPKYSNNVQALMDEIEFFSQFTKTTITEQKKQ